MPQVIIYLDTETDTKIKEIMKANNITSKVDLLMVLIRKGIKTIEQQKTKIRIQ